MTAICDQTDQKKAQEQSQRPGKRWVSGYCWFVLMLLVSSLVQRVFWWT